MSFSATAEPASLARLRGALDTFLSGAGADEALCFDVMLAVSEAVNNVLLHAYRSHAQPGAFTVTVTARGSEIRVLVSDEGCGVAPRSDSPGAGLGLPLMAQLSDRVDVRKLDGGGTAVELVWDRVA
jgi:anti-sigma regulatory factor (Ser/Thr protein kinase)